MDYFKKNLELLISLHGSSFSHLNEIRRDNEYEVRPSTSGLPILYKSGKPLHSRFDPMKEASSFVSALNVAMEDLIVLGLGMGYQLEALIHRFPGKKIIVVESSVEAFCLLLRNRDISAFIENKNISYLVHPEPTDISALAKNLLDFQTIIIPSLCAGDPEYYSGLQESLNKSYKREQINENTLIRFSNIWVRNFFRNLPVLAKASRVSSLKNAFPGIPALLLAAGPSLDLIRHNLRRLRESHLIVAVDTASTVLREERIQADFLVVVDPQYWNCRHLDRAQTQDSILVSESSTYPSVFTHQYREVCFCSSVFPVGKLWETGAGEYGKLAAGGSVSTTALDLLIHLGVKEINIAGLDLGFPSKMTHYKGAFFEHRALVNSYRFHPMETDSVRALYDANPFYENNNSGNKVLTDERLIIYKWWFENYLTSHPTVPTWNLSPQGIAIKGLPPRDWPELMSAPSIRAEIERIKDGLDYSSARADADSLFSSALSSELTRLKRLANQGLHLLDLNKDNPKKLEQLDWIDGEIMKAGSKEIAGFILPDLVKELRKEQQESSLESHFQRMSELYIRVNHACDYHLKLVGQIQSKGRFCS